MNHYAKARGATPSLSSSTTRCASVFARKLVVGSALRIGRPDFYEFYKPGENPAPCACGRACPDEAFAAASHRMPDALVISGADRCFDRARVQLEAVGFDRVERVDAVFVDANETAARCCRTANCARGRGVKRKLTSATEAARRARIDGITRAHRRAWELVIRHNQPAAIFEDDMEALGSARDVAYAIKRCELGTSMVPGCGVAFLGIAFSSYLLSHAYYVSTTAARMLLNSTRQACNARTQDYAIRDLCQSGRVNCTLPPRGLYKSDSGSGRFDGWGLFVQNTARVRSYNAMIGTTSSRLVGMAVNWNQAAANAFQRCQ